MQILLQVVPSFANYQVWWTHKTNISFCKKLYVSSSFVKTFFFFFGNNLKILRLKLLHVVAVKYVSDMKKRKVQIFKNHF